jgi:hypothetical protein
VRSSAMESGVFMVWLTGVVDAADATKKQKYQIVNNLP